MERLVFEKTKKPKRYAFDYVCAFLGFPPLIFLLCIIIGIPEITVMQFALIPFSLFALYYLITVFYIKGKRHKKSVYSLEEEELCIAYNLKKKRTIKPEDIKNIYCRYNDDGSGDIFVNYSNSAKEKIYITSVQAGFSSYEKHVFALFDLKDVLCCVEEIKAALPNEIETVAISNGSKTTRIIKKFLALLLGIGFSLITAILLLGFALEEISGTNDPVPLTIENLSGTWRTTLDLTDDVNEYITAYEEIGRFFLVEDYAFDFLFTFKEDGTFSMCIDGEDLEETMENTKAQLKESLYDYLNYTIRTNHLNITVDEFLEQEGTTIEEQVDEVFASLGEIEKIKETTKMSGYYRIDGNMLELSWDPEFVEGVSYFTVELTPIEMVFLDCTCEEWDIWTMFWYSLEFRRVFEG